MDSSVQIILISFYGSPIESKELVSTSELGSQIWRSVIKTLYFYFNFMQLKKTLKFKYSIYYSSIFLCLFTL